MTVEAKLDLILGNQATILTNLSAVLVAVQSIPGANTQSITDALTQIESQVAQIQSTVGTEAPAPTPVPTPAPTPVPAS